MIERQRERKKRDTHKERDRVRERDEKSMFFGELVPKLVPNCFSFKFPPE